MTPCETEEWKPVPGMENRYEISSVGNVKSLRWRGKGGARILTPTVNTHGYLMCSFYPGGVPKKVLVHRLVAAAFLGPCPQGFQVNHKSGVKTDNSAGNLEYCTPQENLAKAHAAGAPFTSGERNRHAKLTAPQVREIRRMVARGARQSDVAAEFGITQSHVSRVCGNRWQHLTIET